MSDNAFLMFIFSIFVGTLLWLAHLSIRAVPLKTVPVATQITPQLPDDGKFHVLQIDTNNTPMWAVAFCGSKNYGCDVTGYRYDLTEAGKQKAVAKADEMNAIDINPKIIGVVK